MKFLVWDPNVDLGELIEYLEGVADCHRPSSDLASRKLGLDSIDHLRDVENTLRYLNMNPAITIIMLECPYIAELSFYLDYLFTACKWQFYREVAEEAAKYGEDTE